MREAPIQGPRRQRSHKLEWIMLSVAAVWVIGWAAFAGIIVALPLPPAPAPVEYIATARPPGASAIPVADVPGPLARVPLDSAAITARLTPATVRLDAQRHYNEGPVGGSGIILSPNGLVLTDEHVTYQADSIAARVGGTGRTYDAALVGADPVDDVALIQLRGASGLATARFGDVSTAHEGDAVLALGYPDYPDKPPVTHGGSVWHPSLTTHTRPDGDALGKHLVNMLGTTSASQRGMSGGPVVDSSGRVLGIVESASHDATNPVMQDITFSIRAEVALGIARQIAAGEAGPRIVIGLPADLGAVATDAFGVNRRASGAMIVKVRAHSPAQLLGLQVGHTVTGLDETDIGSALDLQLALIPHHPGDRVTVFWTDRFGIPHHGTIALARGPAP